MKKFLITIDTEGDNQWDLNALPSTENAKYIPRFQELAERYGFIPTWLTNYEMVKDKFYVDYMRDCLNRGVCEIGMHLHAWNNPPEFQLKKINNQRDYLFEYPKEIMDEKIKALTILLEDTFLTKMLSHRSGRWSTNEDYFELLYKYGYKVDCSVTPYINWESCVGSTGKAGSDYSEYPDHPYYIYKDILEIPVSIRPLKYAAYDALRTPKAILHEMKWCVRVRNTWIRPARNPSFIAMKKVLDTVFKESDYAMFMLHSSEMMPGGSLSFPDKRSIEDLYGCIEKIFFYAKSLGYAGCKLSDYNREE